MARGADRIAPLFLHGASTPTLADLAVVEGVMGLHDGAVGRGSFASTAHVARLLDAPVILVVDTRSQGRSAAALVLGMRAFDPEISIAGVILNRVGSPRHETLLRAALSEIGVPVVGAIGRSEAVATPSRHLGLIPAAERTVEAIATVRALGALVTASVDLEAVLTIARSAPPMASRTWDPTEELAAETDVNGAAPGAGAAAAGQVVAGLRIAVAGGAAFTFSYAETAELLLAAGAQVVTFDPLRDSRLPPGTRGVIIGGGFPEAHAEALSANVALRADLAAFTGPVVAECAGLLYLARSLDGVPMCGRLPVDARMTSRLTLGYREAVAVGDSCVTRAGDTVRGHEFHRTATDPPAGPAPAWAWDGRAHGFVEGGVHASYLHTHWAGQPRFATRLVEACS